MKMKMKNIFLKTNFILFISMRERSERRERGVCGVWCATSGTCGGAGNQKVHNQTSLLYFHFFKFKNTGCYTHNSTFGSYTCHVCMNV